jgi:hypothetical protein
MVSDEMLQAVTLDKTLDPFITNVSIDKGWPALNATAEELPMFQFRSTPTTTDSKSN